MKTDLTKMLLTGVVSLGTAGLASAGSGGFDIVSGTSHAGVDIVVTVQESTRSNYDFDFVISNHSTGNGASVTGIYIDSGWATGGLLDVRAADLRSPDRASFYERRNAPAGIDSWTGTMASFHARWNTSWGVDEGESATISVLAANSSVTLADIEAALGSSGFNIGVRIQDLFDGDADASAWGLTSDPALAVSNGPPNQDGGGEASGVPTPTAAAAGLALLAIAGYRRRRDG